QIRFQRFTLDEFHHRIPVPGLIEMVINTWQTVMLQTPEQKHLVLESVNSFDEFLWVQVTLAHFLDSDESIAKLDIFGLVHCTEAAFAHLSQNTITPFQQVILQKKPCARSARLSGEGGRRI